MNRSFYKDLAASGLRMPIGTDLVLREKTDAEAILYDGEQLGAVVAEAAHRYHTPLAIPLMDLTVEKAALLGMLGIPQEEIATYHFSCCPGDEIFAAVDAAMKGPLHPRIQANADAIAHVARASGLAAVGMSIGPFSMMTKLIADPIGPVYLAGMGATAEEDIEVRRVEKALELAQRIIEYSIEAQIEAGAQAIIVCEPAANRTYLSPRQLAKGSPIFERYVMEPNRRLRAYLADAGVDLIFHDCGDLTPEMVSQIASLRPVMLSLGSSRCLWEDAALVPEDVVLYGNLPSKRFYSDDLITVEEVAAASEDLLARMRAIGHPFILGSECDVLSVPDCHETISAKVAALTGCGCGK